MGRKQPREPPPMPRKGVILLVVSFLDIETSQETVHPRLRKENGFIGQGDLRDFVGSPIYGLALDSFDKSIFDIIGWKDRLGIFVMNHRFAPLFLEEI